MITLEQFKSLNIGDIIEVGNLIPGFSGEELVWLCVNIDGSDNKRVVTFEVSYYGIWVTDYTVIPDKKIGVCFKECI